MWTLTGFADEISRDLDEQIALLTKLGITTPRKRAVFEVRVRGPCGGRGLAAL